MAPTITCYCSKLEFNVKCKELKALRFSRSCKAKCNRLLSCGQCYCERECHAGPEEECQKIEKSICWCGRESKDVKCGEGNKKWSCSVSGKCDFMYSCEIHSCTLGQCHDPELPESLHESLLNKDLNHESKIPCPFDPYRITHCPCGKANITSLTSGRERLSCTEPIPTCKSKCLKPLPGCSHGGDQNPCHSGPCRPCRISVRTQCRCGNETLTIPCNDLNNGVIPLCSKICTVLKACGRHRNNVRCCPLDKAFLDLPRSDYNGRSNTKERPNENHPCTLPCGKLLTCKL